MQSPERGEATASSVPSTSASPSKATASGTERLKDWLITNRVQMISLNYMTDHDNMIIA